MAYQSRDPHALSPDMVPAVVPPVVPVVAPVDRVPQRPSGPPLHILLTEDNVVNQRVGRGILEKAGHVVVIASNGKQAQLLLERQPFDLVLMDIQMPEMDGFEATAAIRERERRTGKHVPIIAMTAHAMIGDRERCIAAGMDDYITKPVHAPELLELAAEYGRKLSPV
jgi:CheY-like chemotaxis protein